MTNHVVCGTFSSLSPFALLAPSSHRPTLEDLIALVDSFDLQHGIERSLDAKLQNARAALAAARTGNRAAACNLLNAFVNEVQAQSGKSMTPAQAGQLVTMAIQIETSLAGQ